MVSLVGDLFKIDADEELVAWTLRILHLTEEAEDVVQPLDDRLGVGASVSRTPPPVASPNAPNLRVVHPEALHVLADAVGLAGQHLEDGIGRVGHEGLEEQRGLVGRDHRRGGRDHRRGAADRGVRGRGHAACAGPARRS